MRSIVKIAVVLLLAWPLTGFHGSWADICLLLAEKSMAMGNNAAALDYLDQAVEAAPDFGKAYLNRGFLHLKENRHELAIADFSRFIELNPQDASGYMSRGLVYSATGDEQLATADFQRACELGEQSGCHFAAPQ